MVNLSKAGKRFAIVPCLQSLGSLLCLARPLLKAILCIVTWNEIIHCHAFVDAPLSAINMALSPVLAVGLESSAKMDLVSN